MVDCRAGRDACGTVGGQNVPLEETCEVPESSLGVP
jgi:hypothetical protein